eukprot:751625-Hanusia_phi.AAC.2
MRKFNPRFNEGNRRHSILSAFLIECSENFDANYENALKIKVTSNGGKQTCKLTRTLSWDFVQALADRKGCTSAQIALAWLLHQGDDVFPIPGTKSPKRLEATEIIQDDSLLYTFLLQENAGAVNVKLTAEDLQELQSVSEGKVKYRIEQARAARGNSVQLMPLLTCNNVDGQSRCRPRPRLPPLRHRPLRLPAGTERRAAPGQPPAGDRRLPAGT